MSLIEAALWLGLLPLAGQSLVLAAALAVLLVREVLLVL